MFLVATAMLWSCGLEEIGGGDETGGGVWFGPGGIISGSGSGTGSGIGKKVWYAVGVDYPEGYDWRSDEQNGSVRCSLVVFANGVPMMKVPVGDEYEVSADPDMHRMIGRNLYTDYSTDSETVIKKNGVQLFRYEGREMIVDMVIEGEDVYTLGQSREGRGFSFRKNGEVMMKRISGYVFPRIQKSDAGCRFAFCETIGAGRDLKERYFCYSEGEVFQVAVREDVKWVWDVMFAEGEICYIAALVGISSPVLVAGDEMTTLGLSAGSEVMNCRFVSGGELKIEGVISQKGKALFSGLWNESKLEKMFSPGYTVSSLCEYNGDVSCALNSSDRLRDGLIYRCGEILTMPEGYMSLGGKSMTMADGILYVGLTSEQGDSAAVWVDNEMKPLKINGFISHVSVF
jgi:hypothetical protein